MRALNVSKGYSNNPNQFIIYRGYSIENNKDKFNFKLNNCINLSKSEYSYFYELTNVLIV